jgi:hypothetical protein
MHVSIAMLPHVIAMVQLSMMDHAYAILVLRVLLVYHVLLIIMGTSTSRFTISLHHIYIAVLG